MLFQNFGNFPPLKDPALPRGVDFLGKVHTGIEGNGRSSDGADIAQNGDFLVDPRSGLRIQPHIRLGNPPEGEKEKTEDSPEG